MPVARGNANSLVKEFMAFQTLWESQKNDPKSDTVSMWHLSEGTPLAFFPFYASHEDLGSNYVIKSLTTAFCVV